MTSLVRPAASLRLEGGGMATGLGSGALDAAQAGVRRLVVDLSVGEAHDRAELWLLRDSPLADAEPGASLHLGLGPAGQDATDVLTVEVAGVDATAWGAVLVGFAPSRRLASTYVGRAHTDRSVADVVGDLLSAGDVDAGQVDASTSLPVFHVDPRRSAWQHLHVLASVAGCQVTSDADGTVSFTPIPGAVTAGGLGGLAGAAAGAASAVAGALGLGSGSGLREGAELVAFSSGRREPATSVGLASGVNPRGLLVAEPDDGGDVVDVHPALRSQEAAELATGSRAARARRRGEVAVLTVPGDATIRAGGTVTASVRGASSQLRVLQVRHELDGVTGYRCHLVLEAGR